jgi:twitching motility protein PilT
VHGRLEPLEGYEVLRPADTEGIVREVLSEKLVGEFEEEGEADLSYVAEGVGRFRVNAFRQRGSASMVMRFIPFGVPRLDELGLPDAIGDLAREERGIILVTGTTGSGKSTTLAAMIDQMNRADPKHIVTIEDPIEYLHRDDKCLINQREVGSDTVSFSRALRRVLRQDPDVILIGEIRDSETAQIALSAAETGHLVLSTLHTVDATETINRMIDLFPPRAGAGADHARRHPQGDNRAATHPDQGRRGPGGGVRDHGGHRPHPGLHHEPRADRPDPGGHRRG